jgi:hypothetical protein
VSPRYSKPATKAAIRFFTRLQDGLNAVKAMKDGGERQKGIAVNGAVNASL